MINKVKNSLKNWQYAGVTKEVFHSCTEEIQTHNTVLMEKTLVLSIVLFALYAILGTFMEGFKETFPCYVLFLIIMSALYLYYRQMVAAGRKCETWHCSVFVGILFLFCLIKEDFILYEWPGVLVHIVMIATFALYLMPFWYELCLCGSFMAVYLICAYFLKESQAFQLEMANASVSLGLSVLSAYLVDRERISYILSKKLLTNSSTVDELTGVYNRRDFNEKIIRAYEAEKNLGLLMMDIDNFKSYNDTYGHLAGDECLHQVGTVLREVASANGCYVARYGGEEFAIFGTGMNLQEIRQIGWKVVAEVRELKIENQNSPLGIITISAGAAEKDVTRMKAYTDLINEADTALYQAKKAGKNRVETL